MGKDNQAKHRQAARDLKRRAAVRQTYERLLIVCEGEKTEPQYLCEIQRAHGRCVDRLGAPRGVDRPTHAHA